MKNEKEEHGWMVNLYKNGKSWMKTANGDRTSVRERFIGCVENITNPKCEMSASEKRKEIKQMMKNPRLKQMLKLAKPRSNYMKLMVLPLKWNNFLLTPLNKCLDHAG